MSHYQGLLIWGFSEQTNDDIIDDIVLVLVGFPILYSLSFYQNLKTIRLWCIDKSCLNISQNEKEWKDQ